MFETRGKVLLGRGETLFVIGLRKFAPLFGAMNVAVFVVALVSVSAACAGAPDRETYKIDGVEISLNELVDEFLAVSLGRDGRIAKWTDRHERLIEVHHSADIDAINYAAPNLRAKLDEAVSSIRNATGIPWEMVYTPQVPYQESTSSSLQVRFVSLRRWREIREVDVRNYLSYCAYYFCGATYRGYGPWDKVRLIGAYERFTTVPEFAGQSAVWEDYANGSGTDEFSFDDLKTAHVHAHLLANEQRELGHAVCIVTFTHVRSIRNSAGLECLLRSLGFAGRSEKFPLSVLGERLPRRADLFLDARETLAVEEYGKRLPQGLTEFDLLMLRVLYDPRIVAKEDAGAVSPHVAAILREALSSPTRAERTAE